MEFRFYKNFTKNFYTWNFIFLEQLADRLLEKIIVIFSNVVANMENKKILKILSKKIVVSTENLIFLVTCRPDRHFKLVVTCSPEPPDGSCSKNFRPITIQYSRELIICHVSKSRKIHVDFGHSLRKITLTSRPLPRSGSNSQDNLIGTSSTRFYSQLKNFSSDPPPLTLLMAQWVDMVPTSSKVVKHRHALSAWFFQLLCLLIEL